MINLPDLSKLETQTSYTDIFRDTLLWNIGVYGGGIFVLFLILLLLKLYLTKRENDKQSIRQSLLTYGRQSQNSLQTVQNRESSGVNAESANQNPQSDSPSVPVSSKFHTFYKIINFLTSLTFYLTLLAIAGIYLGFYAFGELGRGTGHDVLAAVIMVLIVALPTLLWKRSTRSRKTRNGEWKTKPIQRWEIIITIVMLLLWIGVAIFSVIALKGVCICVFNRKYGTPINGDFVFSTQFTRKLTIQKICKDGQICHLYATLAENASDSVFFTLHTGTDIPNITVTMNPPTNIPISLTNNKPLKLANMQYLGQRNVFSFYFNQLSANTTYNLTVTDSTGKVLRSSKYKTVAGENATELRLAVGGDVGIDQVSSQLLSYLKEFDPDVIILGGDNAYDDGMSTCFYSWDNLYDIMAEMETHVGRIVPLVLTIGNHDVGFNALANVKIDMNNYDELPYYFMFNPQHKSLGSTQIPQPKDRFSYHYHVIGPTVHAHLDSGYIQDFVTQRLFIQKIINNFPNHYKFANYHNPIYPSCTDSTDGSNDRLVIQQGLKAWTPLFDSGKFTAAFEHHTHHRKITNKIVGDKVVDDSQFGTRYVGDGSWGVPQDKCPDGHTTPRPAYFKYFQTQKPNHVWKITIKRTGNNSTIQYTAIDGKNNTVHTTVDNL